MATTTSFDSFTAGYGGRNGFSHAALGRHPAAVRTRIEAVEKVLERALVVPGTQLRFGLDSVIGLVPGIGDIIAGLLGTYIIWEARNLGMSKWTLWRMAGKVGVDTALGAIPLVGDLFDLAFRSNSRNLRLIRRHLDRHHPATKVIEG